MAGWLTPPVAVLLMLAGVGPAFVSVYLLADEWRKPGVLWFLLSMVTGGLWALLFSLITLIPSPRITLVLGHVFWPTVATAAVTMFILAYEFVFKNTASNRLVIALFSPVLLLFALSWVNPGGLVYGADYYVNAAGFLHFPVQGAPLRLLVVQLYGYSLVFLAAGMFVGEALRATGIQRRQSLYLLVVFSALVGSTMIKVAGLVPIYYDPTSTVYAFSGLLFAYSINKHGLLKFVPVAREHIFEEVDDVLLVVDPDGIVIDVNRAGRTVFGGQLIDTPLDTILPDIDDAPTGERVESVQFDIDGEPHYFSLSTTRIEYGRGVHGQIVGLRDITAIKEREQELNLLKEIFSRVFRHNIRNDLSIITGYADLIQEHSTAELADWADRIQETSTHLLAQSSKTRAIEDIIATNETTTGSLRAALERAIDGLPAAEEADLEVSVTETAVTFHPKFHLALQELLENAIIHHDSPGTPRVSVSTTEVADRVRLSIEDDGPGIPQTELDVLQAQEETNLEHSTGIGLWLVRWIVAQSNGSLTGETTSRGTRIRIDLPIATPAEDPTATPAVEPTE